MGSGQGHTRDTPRATNGRLLDELAEASADGTRREKMTELATAPLLIVDDLGMRPRPSRDGRPTSAAL